VRLLRGLPSHWRFHLENVRPVVRNFFPVFVSRGVVQISAYVDALLASLLPTGAVAALAYAQTLYTLPVSLFGMSVSAAELPAMSGAVGAESEVAELLRVRLNAGLRQIAFFVIPSVAAFLVLGDVIVAAIYQSGRFTHTDATYVWGILADRRWACLPPRLAGSFLHVYALKVLARRCASPSCGHPDHRARYLSAIPLRITGDRFRWGVADSTISAGVLPG